MEIPSELFGRAAADYDRLRPAPTKDMLEWVLEGDDGVVLDIGAGTGQVAKAVVAAVEGARVVAVEPDARMRDLLRGEQARIACVAGTAEAIPLPDSSVDAALAGSSWHWFETERALTEVRRVLRVEGVLSAFWTYIDIPPDILGFVQSQVHGGTTAVEGFRDLSMNVPEGMGFDPPELRRFRSTRVMAADDIVDLVSTYHFMLRVPETERAPALARLRSAIESIIGNADVFPVPFVTACWRARRA